MNASLSHRKNFHNILNRMRKKKKNDGGNDGGTKTKTKTKRG